MSVTYVVVIVITIAANAGIAVADFAKAKFVLANSAEVGLPQSWLPTLATLKAAGAVGLAVGLLDVRAIGAAAAIGLVLYFAAAMAAHFRARVFHNIAFPVPTSQWPSLLSGSSSLSDDVPRGRQAFPCRRPLVGPVLVNAPGQTDRPTNASGTDRPKATPQGPSVRPALPKWVLNQFLPQLSVDTFGSVTSEF
ncbi:DoxX family protein [Streptomyces sp. NPDC056831]|uniref:DoxX family protein n=1 Tax=Streptomyces sp. NPDC056831 TaxID=3345954 RepID=UPI0036919522